MSWLALTVGFIGWSKEYNPVLANPKIVTKVDENVVDVALSVSVTALYIAFTFTPLMLGLGYGMPRSVWDCSLPLGQSFRQGPVCSAHS